MYVGTVIGLEDVMTRDNVNAECPSCTYIDI